MANPSDITQSIRGLSPGQIRLRAQTIGWTPPPKYDPEFALARSQAVDASLNPRSLFEELRKYQPSIVGGQAHLEMLFGLVTQGNWGEIDKILARQADNAVKYWKEILGWKRRKGGRPPGASTQSKTFEPLKMVFALLPRFKGGMAVKLEFSKKFRANRRSREETEAELLRRGFSEDEVHCLMLYRSHVSAVIAFVSDHKKVREDTLKRAYHRRLHSKAG